MNLDIEKLKALALAALEQHASWIASGGSWPQPNARLIEMQYVANPAAVLEMIAEVEGLREIVKWDGISKVEIPFGPLCAVMDERDQLKAENEDGLAVLRTQKQQLECYIKDAERYRWLIEKCGVTKLPCAIETALGGDTYVADGKSAIDEAIDTAMAQEQQP